MLYRELGSFSAVAYETGERRPVIRKSIIAAARAMLESENQLEAGLGAYLLSLTDGKNPNGTVVVQFEFSQV